MGVESRYNYSGSVSDELKDMYCIFEEGVPFTIKSHEDTVAKVIALCDGDERKAAAVVEAINDSLIQAKREHAEREAERERKEREARRGYINDGSC